MQRWLPLLVLMLGCFDPQPPAGAPCSNSGACPAEQMCDRGTCVLQPGAPSDASDPLDASGASDAAPDATVTPPDAPTTTTCLAPFIVSTHGCHAFFAQAATMSWDAARDFCVSLGSDLPTITTAAEAIYVGMNGASGSEAARVWVGIRRASELAPWLLVNTTPATFFHWDVGEPNEGFQCAASRPDGLWGDRTCASKYNVACER